MTLDQLRIFVAVAERQHVTRAAEALGLAQSAVSGAVAALEADVGVKLFHRVGRGIALTDAGRLCLEESRAVLARAEAARLRLAELGELKGGRLRLHASQTIASYWLPRHMVDFHRRHPAVQLSLRVGNTAEVAAGVREGEADLGFVEGEIDDPLLRAEPVGLDRLVLVVAPDHPWCREPPAGAAGLRESRWVLREPGSGTRSAFASALQAAGTGIEALAIVLELPTNEAVRAAVEASPDCATVISASVAAPSLEAGLLHQVPFALPERAFRSVQHRERYQSNAVRGFLAMIAERRPRGR